MTDAALPPPYPDPHAAVSYADAAAVVAAYARGVALPGPTECVPLLAALGRIQARPVVADRDQPPFDRSTRDGFACRAVDLAQGQALRVLGSLRAGEVWGGSPLKAGEAIEIMTGAPLPAGADCVVMVEHVEPAAGGVRLLGSRAIRAGENYVPAGAEARTGAMLVAASTRLTPAHIAAAAAAGSPSLEVYARPRVAILSTGDELVPVDATPLASQIRNSNSYSLAAQVLALGGEPMIQPIARDTHEALAQALDSALDPAEGPDLLLLSGGVSMGKYDLVEEVLAGLGARFFFTGVRIQPGKPLVFGELPRAGVKGAVSLPFFGLPGNPISTMVTFALFVAPVLAGLAGERGYRARFAEARLTVPVTLTKGLRRFLPARLTADADAATVAPVAWQGSGDIAGTAQANCLLVVPAREAAAALAEGDQVRVLLL